MTSSEILMCVWGVGDVMLTDRCNVLTRSFGNKTLLWLSDTQLVNSGEDVLVFYNDRASFQTLVQMMRSERDRMDENSPLMYHIHLVELLAVCTEGKNVYTEIKCNSLLPLDDIVRVVTHEDCIPEVWIMSFVCLLFSAEMCLSYYSESLCTKTNW